VRPDQHVDGAAVVDGTEFNLEATDSGATILDDLGGEVQLINELGQTNVLSFEQGIAEPGKPPARPPLSTRSMSSSGRYIIQPS
jgi:hypothetical protein